MNDYISRQAAINAVRSYYDEFDEREESIEELIEQLPSADVVEVVRCKDCKWSDWYTSVDGKTYCHCCETGASGRTDMDFCSYGEREDG